jgi:hypothetical protein
MYEAILREATGNNDLQFNLKIRPYPIVAGSEAKTQTINMSIIAFMLGIAYSLMVSLIAANVVDERVSLLKHF